jgi:acyl-CoA thioesterase FadM
MQGLMTMEAIVKDRVRYHETDAGGGAGERVFIYWFDAARAAVFRKCGDLASRISEGEIAVKTDELFYRITGKKRPSYDDNVTIKAISELDGGSIKFDYLISFEDDGTVIAKGYSVHSLRRNGEKIEKSVLEDLIKEQ